MPEFTVLCADVGSSSVKLALLTADAVQGGALTPASLRPAYFARESYPRNISPAGLEAAFYAGVQKIFSQAGLLKPGAVCISACGPSLFPVTESGEPLTPLWWYAPASRARRFQSFFLPYIIWQREHLPDEYGRTGSYFSPQEYLSWKLGAAPATVLPAPAYRPYYWDLLELTEAGIPPERFFPYAAPGDRLGEVSAEAAFLTGIPEGTPVIAGGVDFIMALRGAGITKPGMALDRAGSSEGINLCVTAGSVPEPLPPGLRLLPHAVDGCWNVSAVIPESGSLFDTYREEYGLLGYPYDELLAALLPEYGPILPAAGLRPLSPAAVTAGRTVLDTLANKVRAALSVFEEAGYSIGSMIISGGQAKSKRWNCYKEERTGCRFTPAPIPDAELAGNALVTCQWLIRRSRIS
jgi:sugar (pentulose or hexulose) kinase